MMMMIIIIIKLSFPEYQLVVGNDLQTFDLSPTKSADVTMQTTNIIFLEFFVQIVSIMKL